MLHREGLVDFYFPRSKSRIEGVCLSLKTATQRILQFYVLYCDDYNDV